MRVLISFKTDYHHPRPPLSRRCRQTKTSLTGVVKSCHCCEIPMLNVCVASLHWVCGLRSGGAAGRRSVKLLIMFSHCFLIFASCHLSHCNLPFIKLCSSCKTVCNNHHRAVGLSAQFISQSSVHSQLLVHFNHVSTSRTVNL